MFKFKSKAFKYDNDTIGILCKLEEVDLKQNCKYTFLLLDHKILCSNIYPFFISETKSKIQFVILALYSTWQKSVHIVHPSTRK